MLPKQSALTNQSAGAMLKCRPSRVKLKWPVVAFLPAQPHRVSKNVRTLLHTERAGSIREFTLPIRIGYI